MADLDIEKKIPPIFNIDPPDISKINPAGQDKPEISQEYQAALQAQQNFERALEERYKKINYFKLAEAFAKPQLGGFLASLGSAAGVLGEQAEAERAIQPTIAKMRADLAAKKILATQKSIQERELKNYESKVRAGQPENAAELREILALAPDSEVGKSIAFKLQTIQPERREETKFGIDIQKAFAESPYLILTDPTYKGVVPNEEQRAAYIENVNKGRPQGISPAEWNAMPFTAREAAIAKIGSQKALVSLEEGQRSAVRAEDGQQVLNQLTELRELALDPKLKPVFALFSDGDLFSQFRAFLDKNPGQANAAAEGLVAATMNKLANADETTRAKFDSLVKGIKKLELRMRGTMNNPTDAAMQVSTMAAPSLVNSQAGFLKIIDSLGLNAYRDIEMHRLRTSRKLTDQELLASDDIKDFNNQMRDRFRQLSVSDPLSEAPDFFYPGKGAPKAKTVSEKAAPTAAGTSAQSASDASPKPSGNQSKVKTQLDKILQEKALRDRQR